MEKKLVRFFEILNRENLDGIFLTAVPNVRYLSGYTGVDSFSLVSPKGNAFITDYRYIEQAQKECKGYDVILYRAPNKKLTDVIKDHCRKNGIKRLGFERKNISLELYETVRTEVEDVELVPAAGLVEELRYVKDGYEQDCLRKACDITDRAFFKLINIIKAGMTEKEVELELHYLLRKYGADDRSFDIIVAAGKNSSKPHAIPSDYRISKGDLVTLDFGALCEGFHADMTRTVIMGKPDKKQAAVYDTVKRAQEEALKKIKAGVKGSSPDKAAADIVADAGYEKYMGKGLGHGIGLLIHEEPFMSPTCERILEAGNVITVEPGIYIPDWGGIRIEDSVIVSKEGCEIITNSSKELISI